MLGGIDIAGERAAQLIDELPVIAAIAPFTEGGVRIRDARELRVKESDRIALGVKNLRASGEGRLREGSRVRGPTWHHLYVFLGIIFLTSLL